jgi:hypothetical protein
MREIPPRECRIGFVVSFVGFGVDSAAIPMCRLLYYNLIFQSSFIAVRTRGGGAESGTHCFGSSFFDILGGGTSAGS